MRLEVEKEVTKKKKFWAKSNDTDHEIVVAANRCDSAWLRAYVEREGVASSEAIRSQDLAGAVARVTHISWAPKCS